MRFRWLLLLGILTTATPAFAQGLIWSLPEDGKWIRYEGTYEQIDTQPESAQGTVTLKWIRQLTIKSVGRTEAEYQGELQPCRWIEIKQVTGKESEAGLDPGPVGTRLYKVLIPEAAVRGTLQDEDGIPVVFLPVVKGYRRIGNEEVAPQPIRSGILNVYPLLCMIRHYRELKTEAEGDDPQTGIPFLKATRLSGETTIESPTLRETHKAELWRTDEVPFGLARWRVRITIEGKDITDPRSAFRTLSTITVDMKAAEVGEDARSELAEQ